MARRLTVAMLLVIAATICATGVGLAVLVGGEARERSVDDLERDALALLDGVESGAVPTELSVSQGLLGLDHAAIIAFDAETGEVTGRLPEILSVRDLDLTALAVGQGRSGVRDSTAFVVVADAPLGEVARRALVVTRAIDNGSSVLPQWLLLATIVAFGIGTSVALSISTRIVRPITDAGRIAAGIAAGDTDLRMPEPPAGSTDELADLSRSINEMAGRLDRARELERQFLLSISHDLRTPLTSIRGYAEALSTGAIKDAAWATSVIQREADRLDRLIRDLLDLARLDACTFSTSTGPVVLGEIARNSVEMLRFRADEYDIGLSAVDDLDGADSVVLADADRVEQMIGNLVDNALKFADSTVVVRTHRTGPGELAVTVSDDGPGIPVDERDAVFDRHYSTGRATARNDEGLGLGLAVVAELAAAFGGRTRVRASELGGAAFTVTLPEPAED